MQRPQQHLCCKSTYNSLQVIRVNDTRTTLYDETSTHISARSLCRLQAFVIKSQLKQPNSDKFDNCDVPCAGLYRIGSLHSPYAAFPLCVHPPSAVHRLPRAGHHRCYTPPSLCACQGDLALDQSGKKKTHTPNFDTQEREYFTSQNRYSRSNLEKLPHWE